MFMVNHQSNRTHLVKTKMLSQLVFTSSGLLGGQTGCARRSAVDFLQ